MRYQDFEEMCQYHQSNLVSHFTHKTFLGVPIENGSITLVNNKLKVIENGVTKEHLLNEEEYDESLVRYFNFNT